MNYQLGSRSDAVRQIQLRLTELDCYAGALDGDFGGGTASAVRQFQGRAGLPVDGIVGPDTWHALFGAAPPAADLAAQPLILRCLALTGAFETDSGYPDYFCAISGDFDGQGISFGVLQWNFGQGSLQPLLAALIGQHEEVAGRIFGDHLATLGRVLQSGHEEQMAFARSIQHPVKHTIYQPWSGYFRALGRTPEFQAIQSTFAGRVYDGALELCRAYDVRSERAVALMFDIKTQNGSISRTTDTEIRQQFHVLPTTLGDDEREVARMRVVANCRAQAANPRWIEDVRSRKLCCAEGAGIVHHIHYDIEQQFGIRLAPAQGP
jgi:Putative peptidoglycan binding domain